MSCNITAYEEFHRAAYGGPNAIDMETRLLSVGRSDRELWRIMDFDVLQEPFLQGDNRIISNGQAMDVAAVLCRESLDGLRIELAGKHGPISDQSIHDEMCNPFCLTTDRLRDEAMTVSGCDCLRLSSGPSDLGFTRPGDWCHRSSGRILCGELGRCGVWDCALHDFHCPRREYDRKEVPLRGYGDNCSHGTGLSPNFAVIVLAVLFATGIVK